MNRWYIILTDPKSWKYISHDRWDTRGSREAPVTAIGQRKGHLWVRGFTAASARRKGEAGQTGLPLASLNNVSERWGTGAGPGVIRTGVKWPLCESS